MSKRKPVDKLPEDHLERVNVVLARVHKKRADRGLLSQGDGRALDGERIEWRNPLTEMMDAEERAQNEMAAEAAEVTQTLERGIDARVPDGEFKEKLFAVLGGHMEEIAFRTWDGLQADFLEWIFAEGPNPLAVVKRVFSYAKEKRPDLLWDMSFRDLGDLLDEEHATVHARCKRLFEGKGTAGWRKSETACRNMSEAQQGNNNRRGAKRRISPPQAPKKTTGKKHR